MLQFNGKQEGKPATADLTCAAPATVSGRVLHSVPVIATGCLETGAWEGDGNCATSPDTGQQGGRPRAGARDAWVVGDDG
jgi:hypothetical protein